MTAEVVELRSTILTYLSVPTSLPLKVKFPVKALPPVLVTVRILLEES